MGTLPSMNEVLFMHSPIFLVGGDLDLFRAKAKKEVGAWSISRKNVRNERISDGRACQGHGTQHHLPGPRYSTFGKVFHVNCEQPTRVVWVKHSLNRGKSRAVVWKIDDKKNLISLLSQSHCFTVSICMTAFLWWVVPITRLSVPVSIHCAYYWVWFQSRAGLSEKGPYPYPSLLLELATPWEPCPLFPCNEGRMA